MATRTTKATKATERENIEPYSKVARTSTTTSASTSTSMSLVDITQDTTNKTDMSIDKSIHEPKRKSQNIITGTKSITTTTTTTAIKEEEEEEEDLIIDIDKYDITEPIFCTDYVSEISAYLREKELSERVDPTYMSRQPYINHRMRGILIDWMVEVAVKFKLTTETSFLATNIVDKYLERRVVERSHLQLVGLVGLLVASKMEEVAAVEVADLVYISDEAYTAQTITDFEREVLLAIDWHLTAPYPIHFLRRYSKAAQSDGYVHTVSKFLVELASVSYAMLKYLPSTLAAAAVYLARRMAGEKVLWSKTTEHYSGYTEEQIMPCVKDLNALVLCPSAKLKAVHKKYASKKFGEVSKLQGIPDLV